MKRIITVMMAIAIAITCAGCTTVEETTVEETTVEETTVEETTVEETTVEETTVYNFPEEPEEEEIFETYLKEVQKRNSSGEFFSDEEIAFFEQEGYTIGNRVVAFYDNRYMEVEYFYYPVIWESKNETRIIYMDDSGEVLGEPAVSGGGATWYGNAHAEGIVESLDFSITYNDQTGEIQVWRFFEKLEEYKVPAGSVYAGFSEFEGYIFRHNTDVYSLKTGNVEMINGAEPGVQVIAHNVAQVIDADYYLGSDPWCQPLFLMTDGTVKAYVGWNGDREKPDSETHLSEIRVEGGYDK